jgi:hypothetical protein
MKKNRQLSIILWVFSHVRLKFASRVRCIFQKVLSCKQFGERCCHRSNTSCLGSYAVTKFHFATRDLASEDANLRP